VRARLERDRRDGLHPAANRSFELYRRLSSTADPIEGEKLVLATDGMPLERLVEEALAYASAP
jgi:hypothetical protein